MAARVRSPELVTRLEALRARLASWGGRSPALVTDAAVAHSETVSLLVDVAEAATVVEVEPSVTVASAAALSGRLRDQDPVLAVGGGAVLDLAKLACALLGGAAPDSLEPRGRAGATTVDVPSGGPALVAVPTTLGTGSERSGNAVMDTDEGRLLLSGPSLVPSLAYLDARASRGLPRTLLLQGTFEALCRSVGPYVGAGRASAEHDELTEAVAARLAVLGARLSALDDPGGTAGDDLRLEVARLGGMTHTSTVHGGREPFAFKAWYVATEVSWTTSTSKTHALAAVLPAAWRETRAGVGFGDAARLERIWGRIAAAYPEALPSDPAEGLEELVGRWGLPRSWWPPDAVDGLCRRIRRRWGDGLPFLRGVADDELERVLGMAAMAEPTPQASLAGPPDATGGSRGHRPG